MAAYGGEPGIVGGVIQGRYLLSFPTLVNTQLSDPAVDGELSINSTQIFTGHLEGYEIMALPGTHIRGVMFTLQDPHPSIITFCTSNIWKSVFDL